MSGLNPQQREAIHYLDGPLLVLAGAGSGKTRVITQKIAYLVQECGFQPRNVAAITFTNKAAKEMQERIGKILSKPLADELQISTFHSLGVRILREEAKSLGYKPRFSIFDSADCAGIIGEVAGTVDKATLRILQSIISNWKNALVTPEGALHMARETRPDLITMDLTMPNMDGEACIEEIARFLPDAQILVVSALSDKATALRAILKGAHGFLHKPFTDEELLASLVELIA